MHFNPRPPWGGRRARRNAGTQARYFNPRPPWGGRRRDYRKQKGGRNISIHALRGEGDVAAEQSPVFVAAISIHALRGEGDSVARRIIIKYVISIHALRGEGDSGRHQPNGNSTHFNPRPPWGGRHEILNPPPVETNFNPRPPWGGRPRITTLAPREQQQFQSTPSVGRATTANTAGQTIAVFQSTPSVGRATVSVREPCQGCGNFNPRPPWGGRLQKYTNMQCYACT